MIIGLLSDTHGFFHPRLPQIFEGVDVILHAGDVGSMAILRQLDQIAPVTAVQGNNDGELPLRATEVVVLSGRRFLVQHIVHPKAPSEALRQRLQATAAEVVVFGHTHQTYCATIDGRLFLNPGSAGRARFDQKVSVARLHLEPGGLRPEFLEFV